MVPFERRGEERKRKRKKQKVFPFFSLMSLSYQSTLMRIHTDLTFFF